MEKQKQGKKKIEELTIKEKLKFRGGGHDNGEVSDPNGPPK